VVLIGSTSSPDATRLAVALGQELLGFHPGPLHHRCPSCGSIEHGRPYFDAALEVSVAHTTGLTLVAVGTEGRIGIDVEVAADAGWVRAEAIGKAYGVGLTGPAGDDALVLELDVPGYVAALAVLAEALPEIRMWPAAEAPEAPGPPATR
jgi:hypothetical protein